MKKILEIVLSVGLLGVMAVFVYNFIKGDTITAEEYEYYKKILEGNFVGGTSDGGGGRGGGGAF